MTLHQAETELRMAALAYVLTERAYHAACEVERARLGEAWSLCNISLYSAEWHAAAKKMNAASHAMEQCAVELSDAIDAEHRVSP